MTSYLLILVTVYGLGGSSGSLGGGGSTALGKEAADGLVLFGGAGDGADSGSWFPNRSVFIFIHDGELCTRC